MAIAIAEARVMAIVAAEAHVMAIAVAEACVMGYHHFSQLNPLFYSLRAT